MFSFICFQDEVSLLLLEDETETFFRIVGCKNKEKTMVCTHGALYLIHIHQQRESLTILSILVCMQCYNGSCEQLFVGSLFWEMDNSVEAFTLTCTLMEFLALCLCCTLQLPTICKPTMMPYTTYKIIS